ncbi:unnamed protein product, partial [Iphiclides podalirius]
MSDVCERPKERRPLRRMRSIYQVHYGLKPSGDEMTAKPLPMPTDPLEVQAYSLQVAGHQTTNGAKYLGLLQCSNGRILKPILKESQRREVDFYEHLAASKHPDLVELRKFTPEYFGVKKFTYNGHEQEYIMLEDLTERMLEPCIMDVKIGKRTWDDSATAEKIKNEESKYRACKQEFGFCIPGYQVFKLSTGKLQKFNKDHGKKLHGHMVIAALRNFLNAAGGGLCRALVLQQLAALWALQRWASRPRPLRLVASSLLLVYDAARLRACCPPRGERAALEAGGPRPLRRKSIHSTHNPRSGPQQPPSPSSPSPWSAALERLKHSHSFEHNYEDKLSKIRMNYRAQLDQLASEGPRPDPWGSVRLIDFAHASFGDEAPPTVDLNFKRGLDGLVALFEALLKETDDQVF